MDESKTSLALALLTCSLVSGCSSDEARSKNDAAALKPFKEIFAYDWTIDPGVETYFCGYETLTDDLFISDFRPVMPSGTHHVVLGYQDPATPDGYVPVAPPGTPPSPSVCTGFTFGDLLAFGAGVGTDELAMPEGVAIKIPAGKQLVFGLHLINTSSSPISGHSGIEVVKPDPSKVVHEAEVILATDPSLSIPPGKSTKSVTCTMLDDTAIFAVMPHMHLTGVHMTTTAGPADGSVVELLNTDYEFMEQPYKVFDPVSLRKGDKMNVACTYENPGSETLFAGESTTKNEMCLALAYRYPAVTANSSNNLSGLPPGYCFDAPPVAGCGDISAPGLEVLASGLTSPATLVVDATSVYWVNKTSNGTVMKVPLGGGKPTTIASGQSHPSGIAVDATSIYWTNWLDGTVMKVPLAGGTPTTFASGQNGPNAIAVDATSVYWANYGDGTIMKEPLTGGTPAAVYSGQSSPDTLAVDAASIYWTNSGDGTVMKGPLAGGTPTTLASGQAGPQGIAVDATSAYWVNHNDGTVMKVPLAGGTPTALAPGKGQRSPDWSGIAVDATSVYWADGTDWADGSDGSVMKVPLAGGTPTTLVSGQQHPISIAVDATSVYWTDACGKVVKLTPK